MTRLVADWPRARCKRDLGGSARTARGGHDRACRAEPAQPGRRGDGGPAIREVSSPRNQGGPGVSRPAHRLTVQRRHALDGGRQAACRPLGASWETPAATPAGPGSAAGSCARTGHRRRRPAPAPRRRGAAVPPPRGSRRRPPGRPGATTRHPGAPRPAGPARGIGPHQGGDPARGLWEPQATRARSPGRGTRPFVLQLGRSAATLSAVLRWIIGARLGARDRSSRRVAPASVNGEFRTEPLDRRSRSREPRPEPWRPP